MSKKTVILFGASGLLGAELLRAFTNDSYTVVAPSRTELDVTDSTELADLFARTHPDLVINAAASINVDAVENDPYPAWQINALAAGAIARALGQSDTRHTHLVHISSNYVFGDAQEHYREDDIPSPVNTYGETKALGESLTEFYCKKAGINYHIIRTSWLYSPHKETFVDRVAKTLLKGEKIEVSPTQFGNLTFAPDLAHAVAQMCGEEAPPPGIYHLVNDVASPRGGISRYEIAVCIAETIGAPLSLVQKSSHPVAFIAKRPDHAVLINTKASPLPPWDDSLRAYIRMKYLSQ